MSIQQQNSLDNVGGICELGMVRDLTRTGMTFHAGFCELIANCYDAGSKHVIIIIEGDYISIIFVISGVYEGVNEASLSTGVSVADNSWLDYFSINTSFGSQNYGFATEIGGEQTNTVNLELTSLGQPSAYDSMMELICEENVEGSFSGTLYAMDPGSDGDPSSVSGDDTYSNPVSFEISFSVPRQL